MSQFGLNSVSSLQSSLNAVPYDAELQVRPFLELSDAVSQEELAAAFRNAASSLVSLKRCGQRGQELAYRNGYSSALGDVRDYLQAALDTNPGPNAAVEGLFAYLDARLASLTDGEEEADEPAQAPPAQSAPHSAPVTRAVSQSSLPTSPAVVDRWPERTQSEFTFACPLPPRAAEETTPVITRARRKAAQASEEITADAKRRYVQSGDELAELMEIDDRPMKRTRR